MSDSTTGPQAGPEERRAFAKENFGKMPVSDRMRPQYVKALNDVLPMLTASDNLLPASDELPDSISVVKGMFGRCIKRDRWDWEAVHEVLGTPSRLWMVRVRQAMTGLRTSVLEHDVDAFLALRRELRDDMRVVHHLEAARAALLEDTPRLPGSRVVKDEYGGGHAPEWPRRSLAAPELTQRKLSSANAEHQATLTVLAKYLTARGHVVEEGKHIDAYCRLRSGPAVFEIKSVTLENELSQCRHALSQLYEYRFRHGLEGASLWLVLSREPRVEPWLVEYLREDRGVRMLWIEDGSLAGPDLPLLTRSSSL